jgi:DNA repair protein RecN (Recombination protein N)
VIEELRITDLGVINEATIALDPGFTVVTGETGAGKTMIVTTTPITATRAAPSCSSPGT